MKNILSISERKVYKGGVVMIANNFSVLLAQRLLKISALAKATGISRVTLTQLYYRRTKQIDLETLDKLCSYLQCNVGDILEFQKGNKKEAVDK